jgi:hypothetical protein
MMPRSSTSASAIRSTIGCASMSPASIARGEVQGDRQPSGILPGRRTCYDQYDGSTPPRCMLQRHPGSRHLVVPSRRSSAPAWAGHGTRSRPHRCRPSPPWPPAFGFSRRGCFELESRLVGAGRLACPHRATSSSSSRSAYLNLGSVKTPVVRSSTGCQSRSKVRPLYTLTNFDSLDLKIGMRWMFQRKRRSALRPHSQG